MNLWLVTLLIFKVLYKNNKNLNFETHIKITGTLLQTFAKNYHVPEIHICGTHSEYVKIILYMLSCHQFPQEGTNHSLVTWLNGEGRLSTCPMHQVMFVLHWADIAVHTAVQARIVCSGTDNKGWSYQPTLWLPRPLGGIIHHPTTAVYLYSPDHVIS